MSHTVTFDFDELVIPLNGKNETGLLIYGKATLTGDGEDFYVSAVTLDGGARLGPSQAPSSHAVPFEAELFNRIKEVIENEATAMGRHAAGEWADSIERMKEAA